MRRRKAWRKYMYVWHEKHQLAANVALGSVMWQQWQRQRHVKNMAARSMAWRDAISEKMYGNSSNNIGVKA